MSITHEEFGEAVANVTGDVALAFAALAFAVKAQPGIDRELFDDMLKKMLNKPDASAVLTHILECGLDEVLIDP